MMITRSATNSLKNTHKCSMFRISKSYNFEYDIYLCGELIFSKGL